MRCAKDTPKVRVVKPRHITRSGSAVEPMKNLNLTGKTCEGMGERECSGGCGTAPPYNCAVGSQLNRLMRPAVEDYVIPYQQH